MLILALFLAPILSIIILLNLKNNQFLKLITLIASIIQFVVLLFIIKEYLDFKNENPVNNHLFLEENIVLFKSIPIRFHIGLNGISLLLIFLTNIVTICGVLISWKITFQANFYFIMLLMLNIGAIGFFMSYDLFLLFFFLEIAVIPKFLLIYIWGTGNKNYSAMKLAILLMFGSFLILFGLISLYSVSNFNGFHSLDILDFQKNNISFSNQIKIFPFLFLGFSVFTAMFPFHSWVPDGHASAPTAGSMFLAGISMKLGSYGCFIIACYLFPLATQYYANYILILATISVLYGALITLKQKDLKYLNAYSSISHCGFIIFGIAILNDTTLKGSVLQMLSHGFMTALFFALIGMIYQRTHTKKMSELGGLLKVIPFISTILIITGLTSLGLPGLSGFIAELFIIAGAWDIHKMNFTFYTILITLSLILASIYILRAIGNTVFGTLRAEFINLSDATWNEKLCAFILLSCIIIIGCFPAIPINFIDADIKQIINSIKP